MAGTVNKVILIGNLGRDPEIRATQDGRPIANLRLATGESWIDKQTGDRRERTEWHTVVIFNENLCKVVEKYLKKGSKIYVEGQLRTRKWQDHQGQDRWSTEVHLQGFTSQLAMLGEPRARAENENGGASDEPNETDTAPSDERQRGELEKILDDLEKTPDDAIPLRDPPAA